MDLLTAKLNPRYFQFLWASLKERKKKMGPRGNANVFILEGSLVIFVFQRACDRESQGTEARVRREPASPFSPINYLCLVALIR